MADFYMLVGLPGSGKSTIAKQLVEELNMLWLSSDAIRGELYGDENCQDNPTKIFELMNSRTIEALKLGKSVIYDATNLSRKRRINLLKTLPKCSKHCRIIWAPYEVCIARDAARERSVGEAVIKKMIMRFETPFWDEGWDTIEITYTSKERYSLTDFNFELDHANPHHIGTLQDHIDDVIRLVENNKTALSEHYPVLYNLAKYHDIGKPFTRTFVNSRGETTEVAHYYQHETVGAYFCLGLSDITANALSISWLVSLHMEYHRAGQSKYYKNLKEPYNSILSTFGSFDSKAL